MMPETVEKTIRAVAHEAIELRHDLHAHPEIRFEERWTSDRVAAFLSEAGVPFQRGFARGTGIVATLQGRGDTGIALRADMDALEIHEETGLAYASRYPNRMHACGHDGHMACLCGAAKTLALHQDALTATVKCIFQPAEEMDAGGRLLVEEGVLEGVHAAFALHVWPELAVGCVGVKSGPIMASADWFSIEIAGRGCHGAHPDAGVDPIVVAAQIILALQTIVSREMSPLEPVVVTVACLDAGHAYNVIPNTARLQGTFRTFSPEVRDRVAGAIERIAQSVAHAFRAAATVQFGNDRYAPLINDPAMTAYARHVVEDALGPDAVVEVARPSMGAEDFAFYLQRVPGALLWLGNAAPAGEPSAPLHNARFDFNDAALLPGIAVLVNLALQFSRDTV